MTLGIARAVFALPVWLINRFAVDTCSGRERSLEMLVDIIYMYHEAGARHACLTRRVHFVLGGDAMQPYRGRSSANFRVHRLAFVVVVNSSGFKPERLHEKVVCGGGIPINEARNNAVALRPSAPSGLVRSRPSPAPRVPPSAG